MALHMLSNVTSSERFSEIIRYLNRENYNIYIEVLYLKCVTVVVDKTCLQLCHEKRIADDIIIE